MRTQYLDMAREHWAQYRPKMCAELKKAGKLEEELKRAATKASDLVNDLVDTMNLNEAEEIVLPRYILLPAEEDVPLLGEGERDPETSVLMG